MTDEPLSVYIHFPYCKSRCPYCDFFRALKPKDFDEEPLVLNYMTDITYFANICGKRKIKSVFFGGGTPSLLSPSAIGKTLEKIAENFSLTSDAEISLEANPNTYDLEKFLSFASVGVNRLSLGVQSLSSGGLKFLGRSHTLSEALSAMETGMKTFAKFSIDMIYARPNQKWEEWEQEINLALSFGLKHISLYELSIEEGTIFHKKNISPLDEKNAAKLYEQTISYLKLKGFSRYEVSNFATDKTNQSVHNLVYWQGGDYIGIGEGAHGRIKLNGDAYATLNGKISEKLTAKERAEELVLMGLRLKEGIDAKRFLQHSRVPLMDCIDKQALKKLAELNLLCYDTTNIRLTDKGFLVLDEIIRQLVD